MKKFFSRGYAISALLAQPPIIMWGSVDQEAQPKHVVIGESKVFDIAAGNAGGIAEILKGLLSVAGSSAVQIMGAVYSYDQTTLSSMFSTVRPINAGDSPDAMALLKSLSELPHTDRTVTLILSQRTIEELGLQNRISIAENQRLVVSYGMDVDSVLKFLDDQNAQTNGAFVDKSIAVGTVSQWLDFALKQMPEDDLPAGNKIDQSQTATSDDLPQAAAGA